MSDADELVAFVRRCLDEDEQVAMDADSGRWLPEDKGITFEYRADVFPDGEAQARLVADTRANQWHIARWDPARVLAEVAAKRRILDLYEGACAEVRSFVTADQRAAARVAQFQLEAVITALAQPYAGRDGWREEWRA